MLSSLSRSSIAAFAALALAAGSAPVIAQQPAMVNTAPRPVRATKRSLFGSVRASPVGRRNAGITVAQSKRNARKARNVARNRRHQQ